MVLEPTSNCGACIRCLENVTATDSGWPVLATRMVLCPVCGNKRCPKATYHENECSDSNEPGQPGSDYPKPIWAEERR